MPGFAMVVSPGKGKFWTVTKVSTLVVPDTTTVALLSLMPPQGTALGEGWAGVGWGRLQAGCGLVAGQCVGSPGDSSGGSARPDVAESGIYEQKVEENFFARL